MEELIAAADTVLASFSDATNWRMDINVSPAQEQTDGTITLWKGEVEAEQKTQT